MGKKSVNLVSIFTGCGGLDLGFHIADNPQLKYKILWANDVEKPACITFANNFNVSLYEDPEGNQDLPSVFCGDIKKVSFKKEIGEKDVDGVLGGFPCQDFSLLRGNDGRKGIKVERGRLYLHFVRALIALQPKFFVAENVKGLVSSNKGKAFKRILEDFEKLNVINAEIEDEIGDEISNNNINGYHIVHREVVDFSKLGVAQARKRLIIIGIRKDLISIEKSKKIRKKLLDVHKRTIFEKYPLTTLEIFEGTSLDELNDKYKNIMLEFESRIKNIDSKRKKDYLKDVWKNLSFDIRRDYFFFNSTRNEENFEGALKKHRYILKKMGYYNKPIYENRSSDGTNEKLRELDRIKLRMENIPPGENHRFVRNTEHHVSGLMSNIYKRIHPLEPSYTVIANGGGGTWGYHYDIKRQKLTNRERARIQSFPDWFKFHGKPSEIRTQIGNAVPPFGIKPFAESLLGWIETIC